MSALATMRIRFQTFLDGLEACFLTIPKGDERQNSANIADWDRRYAKVKVCHVLASCAVESPDPPDQNEQEVFKSRAPAFLKKQPCPAHLKQCDEYVAIVLCPAFMNFGYAPWTAEVEEMYGSDLERQDDDDDNDNVTTESGTSAPAARA